MHGSCLHTKIVDSLFSPYLDSIRVLSNSEGTVKSYVSSLNHFKAFAESKFQCQINEAIIRIKNGDPNDVYRLLNEFVVYLFKLEKKPATIKVAFAATKGLLRHYGIKIYNEDVKQQVKILKNLKHREEPLTKEILVRLLRIVPLKLQTVILVASSSGMRIGELVQLRISDINFGSRPTEIHIRAETTKNRQARDTFTTSEATIALKDYLAASFGWKEGESNQALQNTVIFGRTSQGKKTGDQKQFKSVSSAKSVLSESLRRYVNRIPELNRLNENGRRMIHNHAFRKYCRTIIGDAVGRDFAEALLGHGFYMDTYYSQSKEKRREMYLQAEPHLTISDFVQIEKSMFNLLMFYILRVYEQETKKVIYFINIKNSVELPRSVN